MASKGQGRGVAVSQGAFDALVAENMEEFGMDAEEAAEDAVRALSLQGADLRGIDTSAPSTRAAAVPVDDMVSAIRSAAADGNVLETSRACRALAAPLLESQAQAGADGGTTPGVAPVCLGAVRAGLVEAALKACDVLQERTQGLPEDHVDGSSTLDSGLRTALELLVCSLAVQDSRDHFWRASGAGTVSAVLAHAVEACCMDNDRSALAVEEATSAGASTEVHNSTCEQRDVTAGASGGGLSEQGAEEQTWSQAGAAAQVVALSCQAFELNKEAFMDHGAHANLAKLLGATQATHHLPAVRNLCNALQALVTADDARVLASKAFGNARAAAKEGAVLALVSLCSALLRPFTPQLSAQKPPSGSSATPVPDSELLRTLSASVPALKATCANDEICRSAAEAGALGLLLRLASLCCGGVKEWRDPTLAALTCSALAQLAQSDANKEAAVAEGALEGLVALAVGFRDDSAVLRESMGALGALTLRAPAHAERAAKAGALEVAAEMLQSEKLPSSTVRQTCNALRTMAVRSDAVRNELKMMNMAELLRSAKAMHPSIAEACEAALRDMGEENYRS